MAEFQAPLPRVVALVLAAAVTTACASTPRVRTFPELAQVLHVGDRVEVTDSTGATHAGRLTVLTSSSVTIASGDAPVDLPSAAVVRVARREARGRTGAGIGLAVGGVLGMLAARSGDPSGNPLIDAQAAVGNQLVSALLGTATGALVGSAIDVSHTVYDASAPSLVRHRPVSGRLVRADARCPPLSRLDVPLGTDVVGRGHGPGGGEGVFEFRLVLERSRRVGTLQLACPGP